VIGYISTDRLRARECLSGFGLAESAEFLGLSLEEPTPDRSTLSKMRRLMNLGTHEAVFRWVLKRLAADGLLSGIEPGVDATTLEANAARKAMVRRDDGASYDEHVTGLKKPEGLQEPTPAQLSSA
jgi:transposase